MIGTLPEIHRLSEKERNQSPELAPEGLHSVAIHAMVELDDYCQEHGYGTKSARQLSAWLQSRITSDDGVEVGILHEALQNSGLLTRKAKHDNEVLEAAKAVGDRMAKIAEQPVNFCELEAMRNFCDKLYDAVASCWTP